VRILIVSPHYDDVPFSLGQSIIDGSLHGHRLTVGIVFGRSNWVKWFHPTASRAPLVSAIRWTEEAHAALRFRYRLRVAGLEEAMLRLGSSDASTFRDPSFDASTSDDLEAVETVVAHWMADADLVLCPLGIGSHMDHELCAEVGRKLREAGHAVGWYEDRPYRLWNTDEEVAELASRLGADLERREASGPITSAKRRRLLYPSQWVSIFTDATVLDETEGRREHVWVPAGAAWP
jgi:hypothetical protein